MSNKESFPTNGELQNQLSIAGRNLFVGAFQRELESQVPGWLLGKNLGNLALTFTNEIEVLTQIETEAVICEKLQLRFASADDAGIIFQQHPRLKNNYEIYDKTMSSALFYGNVALEDITNFREIPPESIITHYEAIDLNNKAVRNISSVKNKLDKQTLYHSIAMAMDAENYANSDEFTKNFILRLTEYEQGYADTRPTLRHEWQLPFSYNINFNGNESREYLHQFINEFAIPGINHAKKTLKKAKISGLGKTEITKWEDIVDIREKALDKANLALLIKTTPLL
jgi:hypothetical protein